MKAYRLPWKNNDNPQCFLEITKSCNADCASCYQKDGFRGTQHKPVELIKEEIDLFEKELNVSAVCIIGGEPLLHPDILEIVSYIAGKNITPALFSNVIALNEKLLKELKLAGVGAIFAHIDEQISEYMTDGLNTRSIMERRNWFAELLRNCGGGIYGMVNAIIGTGKLERPGEILKWAYENSDVIKYCIFTIDGHKKGSTGALEMEDVCKIIREDVPDFKINSFLPGTDSDKIHWGQSVVFTRRKNRIRFLTGFELRFLDKLYRLIFKKYVSIISPGIYRHIQKLFTTVIVRPHSKGTVDFCASCPDQTILWVKRENGRMPLFVHSCLSQDFIREGMSPEEDALAGKVKNDAKRLPISMGLCNGNLYNKNETAISDWDQLRKYRSTIF